MKQDNAVIRTSPYRRAGRPWHLWATGLLFLFLYSYAAYDFVMVQTRNAAYFKAHFTAAIVNYFTNYPKLFLILWGINVVCGIVAAILLLFRARAAAWFGVVSAFSMLFQEILTFLMRSRWKVFGPKLALFDIAMLVITCAFAVYCVAMEKRGTLQ